MNPGRERNGEEERVEDSGRATRRRDEGEIGMVFVECHVIIGRYSTVRFDERRRHLSARLQLGATMITTQTKKKKQIKC